MLNEYNLASQNVLRIIINSMGYVTAFRGNGESLQYEYELKF